MVFLRGPAHARRRVLLRMGDDARVSEAMGATLASGSVAGVDI
jgi:hypothetical protein